MHITIENVSVRAGSSFHLLGSRSAFWAKRLLAAAMLGVFLALEAARMPLPPLSLYAGSKSDYLENKFLDHVLGNTAYTAPTTVYFALFTTAPSDSGGGTEVTGGSYARVAVTNNTTNFPNASGGVKSNGTTITWPQATASWGVVTAIGVFDASSGGNLLFWCTITSKTVDSTDTVSIASTQFSVTED